MNDSIIYSLTLPPGEATFGYEGRDLLAKILDGQPVVSALFHYEQRDGKRHPKSSGMPMARIRSSGKTLRIVSLDDETNRIVLRHSAQICEGVARHFGTPLPAINITSSPIGAEQTARPYLYKAHHVVLARGLDACKRFEQMSGDEQAMFAHGVLCRGLQRQSHALGIDLPDLPAAAIEVSKIIPRAPIITRAGRVLEYGVIADLLFYWEAMISGSWAAGGLTSRGNGRIWYVRGGGDE